MRKIKFYGVSEKAYDYYESVIKEFEITCGLISDELDKTLEEVMSEDSIQSFNECEDQFMIIDGVEMGELKKIVHELHHSEYPFEGIMIGVTPTNSSWSLNQLFAEVKREHSIMNKKELLQQLMKSVNDMPLKEYDEQSTSLLKTALIDAFILQQNPNPREEELDETCQKIKQGLKNCRKIES